MRHVLTAAALAAWALGGVGCDNGKPAKTPKDVGDAFRVKVADAGWADAHYRPPDPPDRFMAMATKEEFGFIFRETAARTFTISVFPVRPGAKSYGSFQTDGKEYTWQPAVGPEVEPLSEEKVAEARELARELVNTYQSCR
jgi:hypothetical protein